MSTRTQPSGEREKYDYEEGAELRTETLWCCKTCGRAWPGDAQGERAARACCVKTMPCSQAAEGCTGRTEYAFQVCRGCRERFDAQRHAKRETKPWDGETPLYDDASDRFLDADDVHGRAADGEDLPERLLICEPTKIRSFNLSEWLEDCWPEDDDGEIDVEGRMLEEQVNAYLDRLEARPLSWERGKYAPDPASLPKVERDPEAES